MGNSKINQEIKTNLFSANTEVVLQSIQKIKEKGNPAYLPLLFDILKTNTDSEIEKEITQLLSTVKQEESIPVFMEAVKNKKYKTIQKKLLETCWQNGLNFADYLVELADISIHSEWEIAFEAFTIIDNFEKFPAEDILDKCKDFLIQEQQAGKVQNDYFYEEIQKKIS